MSVIPPKGKERTILLVAVAGVVLLVVITKLRGNNAKAPTVTASQTGVANGTSGSTGSTYVTAGELSSWEQAMAADVGALAAQQASTSPSAPAPTGTVTATPVETPNPPGPSPQPALTVTLGDVGAPGGIASFPAMRDITGALFAQEPDGGMVNAAAGTFSGLPAVPGTPATQAQVDQVNPNGVDVFAWPGNTFMGTYAQAVAQGYNGPKPPGQA